MLEKLHNQTNELKGAVGFDECLNSEVVQYIRYCVGLQDLLIRIDSIVQVSGAGRITTFPGNHQYLRGLIVTRGDEVTPVVNLAEILGLTSQKTADHQCCLVVAIGDERFGLLVDSVEGLLPIEATLVEHSHNDLFGGGVSVVSGVFKDSESVFPIIDVKAIFQMVFSGENRYEHTAH